MSGTTARRRMPILAACAITLASAATARAREKTAKPVCRVEITDTDGLPLAPMSLVSFEDGLYRLRTREGREIELAEEDVGAVRFMPLSKPHRDKPAPETAKRPPHKPPEGERGDTRWRPKGHDRRENPFLHRMKEEREKLLRLKHSGALGREIEALKTRLRVVNSPLEAAALIRRIVAAKTVQDGAPPSDRDLKDIVASIGKSEIRERMKNIPAKYFRQPVGQRGPRR